MTVLDWLLDSDPALRWQVLRDLSDAPPEVVAVERARVVTEGWGARLLALRGDDGQWAGGACFPADFRGDFSQGQPWTSTLPTLTLLRDLGIDPNAPPVRETVALVRENSRWEHAGQPFFAGEVEPCINGRTVAAGAYFGADVDGIVARLLGEQLADGGWNCEAENGSVRSSFATTICVLEGLLEHEQAVGGSAPAAGGSARSVAARRRGEEYLLDRALFRRLSTGEVADPAWLQFSFPGWWHYDVLRALDYFRAAGGAPDPRLAEAITGLRSNQQPGGAWLRFSFPGWWHYDVLRALDYFRAAGDAPDPRVAEAITVLRSKQQPDGTWLLENTHPGAVHFPMEDGDGQPSRWNTLRALRVLRWHDGPIY